MADAGALPHDVRDLVLRHVSTPAHLDVLLALAGDESRTWTVAEAEAVHQGDRRATAEALRDLAAAGLLWRDDAGSAYRFAPQTQALRETVGRLVEAQNRTPVQLIRAVYDRPPPALQSFADAFRLQPPR
jgi:hypothetical protein